MKSDNMKKTLTGVLLVFLFSAVFAGSQALVAPATDLTGDLPEFTSFAIYADFPGINGEVDDKNHIDWVEMLSFEFSMHKPTSMTGSSRRRGDIVLEDIILTKYVDKSTPKLMEKTALGEVLSTVEIDIVKTVSEVPVSFYHYTLENVIVTSYKSQGHTLEDAYPWDTLTLRYEEITVRYTQYDSSGGSMGNIEWNYNVEGLR
jgi:type VI secretion system secreted protein Hcp